MSEALAAPRVFLDGAIAAPGLYRNVDTGAVIEVCAPKAETTEITPGLHFGKATSDAGSILASLMGPSDQACQMLAHLMMNQRRNL